MTRVEEHGPELRREATRPLYAASQLAKPVVAALNGSAAGIGLSLACSCDVRFCAAGAKLTTAYALRLRLFPALCRPLRAHVRSRHEAQHSNYFHFFFFMKRAFLPQAFHPLEV